MKFACGWKRLRNWINPGGGDCPNFCVNQNGTVPFRSGARFDRTAFCVCGMHRSGTSMVSQVLSRFGVYMGPENVLTVSAEDNQDGFWEDDAFVKLNDEILRFFSGAWDAPPAVERGWEYARGLSSIRRSAKQLLHKRTDLRVWGWKDPRTSLTLPFWKRLIPGLRIVVCLRHPSEVAQSLNRRNRMPISAGLELWRTYQSRLLAATAPAERIITHYDSHFADPAAEIARIADFLGVAQAPALPEELSAACKEHLRNNRVENGSPGAILPGPIADLYSELCEQAGPVFRRIVKPRPVVAQNECVRR